MSERSELIAARAGSLNSELIEMVRGLSAADLELPCDDPAGHTVGAVVDHLAEGAEEVIAWAQAAMGGAAAQTASHPPHTHDNQHANLASTIALLERGAETSRRLFGGLTDEHLDGPPPAARGISDGSVPLAQVLERMLDHQAEHMGYMKTALTKQASRTPSGDLA